MLLGKTHPTIPRPHPFGRRTTAQPETEAPVVKAWSHQPAGYDRLPRHDITRLGRGAGEEMLSDSRELKQKTHGTPRVLGGRYWTRTS